MNRLRAKRAKANVETQNENYMHFNISDNQENSSEMVTENQMTPFLGGVGTFVQNWAPKLFLLVQEQNVIFANSELQHFCTKSLLGCPFIRESQKNDRFLL